MKAKKFLVLSGMSAMLGLSILPGPAGAQVQFGLREDGIRIQRADEYDRRYYRDDQRYYREDRRYDRDREGERYGRYRPGCSPREALAAASRYLNDPRINSVNRNFYFIDGFGKRGGSRNRPDSVMISTAPGCQRA